jgi:uncharacterized membrane protein (UPF0127 family)
MKASIKKRVVASNICDCKGLMSAIGLRFKNDFEGFDAFLIHMLPDSILDSYFVYMDFTAAWLDKSGRVLKVEYCKPWKIFNSVDEQSLVIEFKGHYKGIKKDDVVKLY